MREGRATCVGDVVQWSEGSLHRSEVRGRTVWVEDGRPRCMKGAGDDITERKGAERILRESIPPSSRAAS